MRPGKSTPARPDRAPGTPLPTPARPDRAPGTPLEGVRVLDLTRLLPGAYATLLLADLGADVIKIEEPRRGDHARRMPPFVNGEGVYFIVLNRNKRSVTLDLRSAQAPAVLDALAVQSDVIIDSFRPTTAKRLGVDAETLRARHPRLVCASISGFGRSGPYVGRAAHDINYEALAGLLMPRCHTRPASSAPLTPGPLVGDVTAAMQAVIAILAALVQRERTGSGATVDVAIYDAALSWLMFPTSGEFPRACYGLYETADRRWLAIGALEAKFWNTFCERIGRSDLIGLQYASGAEGERVWREVRDVIRTRTHEQWLAHFRDADACLTTVSTPDEALSDPQVAARGTVAQEAGITYITAPGVKVRRAPSLGADTDEILEAAGITAAERARLRSGGVV